MRKLRLERVWILSRAYLCVCQIQDRKKKVRAEQGESFQEQRGQAQGRLQEEVGERGGGMRGRWKQVPRIRQGVCVCRRHGSNGCVPTDSRAQGIPAARGESRNPGH